MSAGRTRVRAALTARLTSEDSPTPVTLTDLFAADLDTYAELIAGPAMVPVGFMTHGEGREFTERVRIALQILGMSADASARHQAMATWFEHKLGFFKAEWHRAAHGFEPLAAIYFRRRPPIAEVLAHLTAWGLPVAIHERVNAMAAALAKDTIHFVAAAFRPSHPVHHKLYFSQWVTVETRATVTARIAQVFELFGFQPDVVEAWRASHERCVGPDDTTLFVSMSCSEDGVSRNFKIDYPDLTPELAASWVPAADRDAVIEDARRTMRLGGTKQLTFTGVRFATDRATPSLKYYSDVPGSR
ncbi:MAG: hypothetical protein NT062_32270 [Proteobacteria bacterium]|nr:hypothetical protein [Pseudomonadota bacterium]